MKLHIDGENVYAESLVAPERLRYIARDIREERTGVHAEVTVYDRRIPLGYDVFNLGRTGDRTKLRNAALSQLDDDIIDKRYLQHELNIFCSQVWDTYLNTQLPQLVKGDPTLSVEFLASPHILIGGGTILYGTQGHGKSYTALLASVAVDAGVNGIWQTKQKKVLYVNLERSAQSLARRLSCVNIALGLDSERPLMLLNSRGKSLGHLQTGIQHAVDKFDVGLVVLDSISRTGAGDLSTNETANSVLDVLNGTCESWLGLGHAPRSDTSHVYGSTFWDAGADVMVALKSDKADESDESQSLGVRLEVTKANDIQFPPAMTLRYDFDAVGLTHASVVGEEAFPTLVEHKTTVATQLSDLFAGGHLLTLEDIYRKLPDVGKNSIRVTLTRRKSKEGLNMFSKTVSGAWKLADASK